MVKLYNGHPRVLQVHLSSLASNCMAVWADRCLRAQVDEVVDVGAAGQRNQPEAAEADQEEEDGAPRRMVPLGSKHLLKVCLSDGLQRAVGLDLRGTLAAAYHAHVSRLPASGDRPSLQAFFAGSKVSLLWVAR